MSKLVLLRHGQSQWNLENRFTGWVDVDLTEKGEKEARRAGKLLKKEGISFDQGFTSVQTRAIRTLWLALAEMKMAWLPIEKDWRLNERHYGGLTGLDKTETAEKHGKKQVHVWRRSYDTPPPPLDRDSKHHPIHDRRYAKLDPAQLPDTESLKLTLERVLPYWKDAVEPRLKGGENLVVSAHGNSLRAVVKHLFGVSDEEISDYEIPTGNPLLIELDDALKVTSARYLDAGRAKPVPPLP